MNKNHIKLPGPRSIYLGHAVRPEPRAEVKSLGSDKIFAKTPRGCMHKESQKKKDEQRTKGRRTKREKDLINEPVGQDALVTLVKNQVLYQGRGAATKAYKLANKETREDA